jgi:hypothetical protein
VLIILIASSSTTARQLGEGKQIFASARKLFIPNTKKTANPSNMLDVFDEVRSSTLSALPAAAPFRPRLESL